MAQLSLIQKAVDTISIWADKINLGFSKADQNEADVALLKAEQTQHDAEIAANTVGVSTNADAIADHETRMVDVESEVVSLGEPGPVYLGQAEGPVWTPGMLSWDSFHRTGRMDTSIPDVRVQLGQEVQVSFYNPVGSGVTIQNGQVVNATGVSGLPGSHVFTVDLADASSPLTSSAILGLSTSTVTPGNYGLATSYGEVHGFPTLYNEGGLLYLSDTTPGGLTNTRPRHPSNIVIIGSNLEADPINGTVFVDPIIFNRAIVSSTYFFSSDGLVAATNQYIAGSYDWAATSVTLDAATTTQLYGSAGAATGSHAGVVFGAAVEPTTGVIGLRVTGTSFTDEGVTTPGDVEILSTDLLSHTLNDYLETSKNWTGEVTFELYSVTGDSLAGSSVSFNYGFAAYVDAANREFTLTNVRLEGLAGFNDASFNVRITKHDPTVWTYAATGFTPGNGTLVDMATDMAPNNALVSGKNFKWKRANLQEYIDGAGTEGYLIAIDTSNKDSVTYATMTLSGVSEQFS